MCVSADSELWEMIRCGVDGGERTLGGWGGGVGKGEGEVLIVWLQE